MEPMLLRVEEAAKLLGMGRSKTYAMIARGELPHIKVGGSVRVPVEALREWIRQQTQAVR